VYHAFTVPRKKYVDQKFGLHISVVFKTTARSKQSLKKAKIRRILPWRRGAVDIASASGTRRPGFEYRQSKRFLGKHSSAVVYKMTYYALFVC
jgi:hypothetical protein